MAVYSNSRLSTFEDCPLKFKYNYIDREKIKSPGSIEQFLGSRVHETLEKLYKDLKFKKENSLQQLLDYFNKLWKENYVSTLVIVRKDYNEENYRKMGEQYIADYYNRYKPFNQSKTLALEKTYT